MLLDGPVIARPHGEYSGRIRIDHLVQPCGRSPQALDDSRERLDGQVEVEFFLEPMGFFHGRSPVGDEIMERVGRPPQAAGRAAPAPLVFTVYMLRRAVSRRG